MKIERKMYNRKDFRSLNVGAVFGHENYLYIKIEGVLTEYGDELYNVVNLQTGGFDWFNSDCVVEEYPEATIVI